MSSAANTGSANEDFAARLSRIKSSNGQTIVMVGQDEKHIIERKQKVQHSRRAEVAGNLIYPASLLGAMLLGAIAVFLSKYIRFQLMEGSAVLADNQTELLVTGGIGITATFVLAQAFRLTSKEHRALQGAGVMLMAFGFPNLCHWLPGPMSMAFSAGYVQNLAENTPRLFADPITAEATTPSADSGSASGSASGTDPAILSGAPASPETAAPTLPTVRKAGKIVKN